MRRVLVIADVAGLTVAFLTAEAVMRARGWAVDYTREVPLFAATLPVWVLVARMYGLYDRDEERTDHSTLDDLVGVFHLVTVGAWVLYVGMWLIGLKLPPLEKVFNFWIFTVAAIVATRAAARTVARALPAYRQRTVIVGAGEIGQLVGRKYRQHPEYGIDVVGFVDSNPRERRADLGDMPVLGPIDVLQDVVQRHDVERVVIAFSEEPHERMLRLVRRLRDENVQIDIVPRLFEIVAPNVELHSVEGLALVGLPPVRLSRSSKLFKRTVDLVGAVAGLILTAPVFLYATWRIRRESPGPVFFRQERLGEEMRPFTMLKFRTMRVDTDDSEHRQFIRATMSSRALPAANGIYKLDRSRDVTRFGRWLRKTSLDELPQLVNVLRGEMSLVGPRPCIAYELENFEPHHFDRFLVRPGITGLWQVTARAHASFGEALDIDVRYVRGWSLGLDLWLLIRTPLGLLRGRTATA
jgi:exopolysaccharide biosynthesis polyprenyl glycosylphosphotransferase